MLLGSGKIDQQSAQAAAWHLTDGLSWNALARKIKVKHLSGHVEMFFSPQHVRRAMQIVSVSKKRVAAKQAATQDSPGVRPPSVCKISVVEDSFAPACVVAHIRSSRGARSVPRG